MLKNMPRHGIFALIRIKILLRIWGEGAWKLAENVYLQPEEAHYLKLDCTKAHHQLNWRGILNVEETLDMTIRWYKEYYNQSTGIYDLCLKQIKAYIAVAQEKQLQWVNSLVIPE